MNAWINRMKWLSAAAGAIVMFTTTGAAFAQSCENPKVLRFSMVPTQDSVRELSYYKPVLDQLVKNTGRKIEFFMPTSYSSVVEAMLGKWVDFGVLGPESYVIAKSKSPAIEVFATYHRAQNGIQEEGPGYRSILITKKGSKFTSIESLKGSVIALVDPASTSGGLVPEKVFPKAANIPPLKQYFSRVVYAGAHDLAAIAVAEGKADAGFAASHRFMETVNAGKVKLEDFNILWQSPVIPQDPFVLRSTLCDDIKKAIIDTFMSVDKNEAGQKYLQNVKSLRIVPMKDSDYDIVREANKK
jgi:phosphonate transport system substrate-binding protein